MKELCHSTIGCPELKSDSAVNQGLAWIALCLALAIHVMDEALTDFLSVYNPTVLAIREKFPFLPLPTFSYEIWLAGLILAVIILLFLALWESPQNTARYCGHQISMSNQGAEDGNFD